MKARTVQIASGITVGQSQPLLLIAGPCQIESLEHCRKIAGELREICSRYPVNLVFKSSFDKANRTSLQGRRGIGLKSGLEILHAIRSEFSVPVLTDVHSADQIKAAASVVDVLQTPAFLCRQTDLLIAAGSSGKAVNCKKGQFLHPSDMKHVAEKISSTGNHNIMLCERGASFGYRDLVFDPRSLIIMNEIGYPVVFDATHSVQSMGGQDGSSGGMRQYVAPLARAAAAVGIDGLFIECHDDPDNAPSDGPSMLPMSSLEQVLRDVCAIRSIRQIA